MSAWRGLALTLVLAVSISAQQAPLTLEDVTVLLRSGVDGDVFRRVTTTRGLRFPKTPGIERYLKAAGLDDARARHLWPAAPEPPTTRHVEDGVSLAFDVPKGWTLEGGPGSRRLTPEASDLDGATLDLSARTFPIADAMLAGEHPRLHTLQDLLEEQQEALPTSLTLVHEAPRPLAARGITGSWCRSSAASENEPLVLIVHGAFSKRDRLFLWRAALRGPSRAVLHLEATVLEILRSVAPKEGADDRVDRATRIVVVDTAKVPPSIVAYDRSALRSETLCVPDAGVDALLSDPLCLQLVFLSGRRLYRPAPTWDRLEPRDLPESVAHVELVPGSRDLLLLHSKDHERFLTLGNQPRIEVPPEATVPVVDVTGREILWALVDPRRRSVSLVTWRDGAIHLGPVVEGDHASLLDDPGSPKVLLTLRSTHRPVPKRDAPPPAQVVRFTYLDRSEGPERPAFLQVRRGEGIPLPLTPRFLPSAHELVYVDQAHRVCIVPRDGGLPVVLLRGPVRAAVPWLAPP